VVQPLLYRVYRTRILFVRKKKIKKIMTFQQYLVMAHFKTLLWSFTNLLFRISGSKRQSHVISVNEASLCHKCFGISVVHVTFAVWYVIRNTDSKQKSCKASKQCFEMSLKSRYFVFLAHKKYSHCFIILRLNHCSHMNHFKYVFNTFLGTWKC